MVTTSNAQLPLFQVVPEPPNAVTSERSLLGRGELKTRAMELATWLSGELKVAVRLVVTDNRSTMVSYRKGPTALILRLHHMFLDAPDGVRRALADYAGRSRRTAGEVLDDFIRKQQPRIRRERNPSAELNHLGRCFNLKKIMESLNRVHFENRIQANIGWGRMPHRGKRKSIRLGVYDHQAREIRINPILDRPEVPAFFVEFIVFHEMLHQIFPDSTTGRRVHHPKEFRLMEKTFPLYTAAIAWEKQNLKMLLQAH